MSHFIRCDRCDKQDTVIGSISLPPGWQTILHADLCEPCCQIVRDFIRFKPSDADKLPVEPIEEVASIGPANDKLFETAPEGKHEETQPSTTPAAQNSETPSQGECAQSDPLTKIMGTAPIECSTEERARTRRRKPKMQGQDAILPDNRPKPDARPGEPGPA